MVEVDYHITRAEELGLPEGTGKRYSEVDLIGFIEASPEIRNPFTKMLEDAVAKYRRLTDKPYDSRRAGALDIFEYLIIDYALAVMPKDVPKGVTEKTRSYLRLPSNRVAMGNQQEIDFLRGLLNGTPLPKEQESCSEITFLGTNFFEVYARFF